MAELRSTVERMEERLMRDKREFAQRLIRGYNIVVQRFANDLDDERDQLLSRGGALMLAQELLS